MTAQSVADPLVAELAVRPFEGRVAGVFDRACNVIDAAGRVLAVTLPEVGNGPFSVVIRRWEPGLRLALGSRQAAVRADARSLRVGDWQISWHNIPTWNARLACLAGSLRLSPAVASLLAAYRDWPGTGAFPAGLERAAGQARRAAGRLAEALNREAGPGGKIVEVAGQLAGLGNGLTPAGDDYLLGVMAALWLTGKPDLLPAIAQAARPKTTALSACFLAAAARGDFAEPWHQLAGAMTEAETGAVARAVAHLARSGASSGRDALAGFAEIILKTVPVS